MTAKQYQTVVKLIGELKPDVVLHGDCKGSDEEFHKIVEKIRGNFGNSSSH
jgi:glycerol-3-phosphate cytidylyltransferase-like family protein